MDKQLVVVTRKWHEPFIRVDVTTIGIGISMTLEDFIHALGQESGASGLAAAADRVVAGMKRESTKAM